MILIIIVIHVVLSSSSSLKANLVSRKEKFHSDHL